MRDTTLIWKEIGKHYKKKEGRVIGRKDGRDIGMKEGGVVRRKGEGLLEGIRRKEGKVRRKDGRVMGKKERLPQLVSASTGITIQEGKREGRRKGIRGWKEG